MPPEAAPVTGRFTGSVPGGDGDAAGQSAELVKHWRILGTAFDALIRSARAGDPSFGPVSSRVLELWAQHPQSKLRVSPVEIEMDGEVALATDAERGRWILPAFMSGLRSVRIRTSISVEDVRHFGEELAGLEANVGTITRFRDWLWSEGAQGFEVELHASFVEAMDDMAPETGTEKTILATRFSSAIAGWNNTHYLASKELDAAAVREEFQVPLSLYISGAETGSLPLAGVDADHLRTEIDDAAAMSGAEMDAVMDHHELRGSMSSQRLARRLIGMIESAESVDARLLEFLGFLGRREDPYCRAVVMALESETLGASIAAKARLDRDNVGALRAFVGTSPPAVGHGLLHGLLERAAADEAALAAVLDFARELGAAAILGRIDPARLTGPAATALGQTLIDRGEPLTVARDLALQVTPRAASRMLAALPQLIPLMKPRVLALLIETPAETRELLLSMLAGGRAEDLALLGQALVKGNARGWGGKPLQLTLQCLVAAGLAHDVLVPIVRSRHADLEARLKAIEALRDVPDALEAAVRWRSSELLDPPVLRSRLRHERRRLKEAPRS